MVEAVEVEGLAGEDVFTVTAGAVPIGVVGGDPIGVSAGDQLVLAGPVGPVVYEPGPSADSGAFVVAGTGAGELPAAGGSHSTTGLWAGGH